MGLAVVLGAVKLPVMGIVLLDRADRVRLLTGVVLLLLVAGKLLVLVLLPGVVIASLDRLWMISRDTLRPVLD